MVFWRFKKNESNKKQEQADEVVLHHAGDPAIEPATEYDADIDPELAHAINPTEGELAQTLDAEPVPAHTPLDDAAEAEDLKDHSHEGGWLSKLVGGLTRTTSKWSQDLGDLLTKRKLDGTTLEDLEDMLISVDLGPKTAARIVKDFANLSFARDASVADIKGALAGVIADILAPVAHPLVVKKPAHGPFVILVTGVNGVGKTTTIGKLGHQFQQQGLRVMFAAGDTFRAAAVEQLTIWGQRLHVPVLSKDIGADAASVAFEAYEAAKRDGADVLLIDTAGRLQNKANLMEELAKIVRVLQKHEPAAPHATLLVLDATTGQNAYAQVEAFSDIAKITGLVVTKLDGSAKAGVVVGLAHQYKLPVHAVGVGEGASDLQPFTADAFARALVGLKPA